MSGMLIQCGARGVWGALYLPREDHFLWHTEESYLGYTYEFYTYPWLQPTHPIDTFVFWHAAMWGVWVMEEQS